MVPAIYASTVNPIQNNAMMENGRTVEGVAVRTVATCAGLGGSHSKYDAAEW
jgi:hypothetical protein